MDVEEDDNQDMLLNGLTTDLTLSIVLSSQFSLSSDPGQSHLLGSRITYLGRSRCVWPRFSIFAIDIYCLLESPYVELKSLLYYAGVILKIP